MTVNHAAEDATHDGRKADLFEFDLCAFDFHFPCAICTHREEMPDETCHGCRFYIN